jgi:hypothetical protein
VINIKSIIKNNVNLNQKSHDKLLINCKIDLGTMNPREYTVKLKHKFFNRFYYNNIAEISSLNFKSRINMTSLIYRIKRGEH